jgi:hypothetical protein
MMRMAPKASRPRHAGPRITVTFPQADYDRVCVLARSKKVSAAWIVRDAVEKYLQADQQNTEGRAK